MKNVLLTMLLAVSAGFASIAQADDVPTEKRLASGVVVKYIKAGNGAKPTASDTVQVHYEGTLPDGSVFDSSYQRGTPTSFPLNRVIPCWTQGVAQLGVGDKAILTCPANTAYGANGIPGTIPPNTQLTFKVELLRIQ